MWQGTWYIVHASAGLEAESGRGVESAARESGERRLTRHGTWYSVQGTGYRAQGTRCRVHGTWYSVKGTATGYSVYGAGHRAHGTGYVLLYMVLGTGYMVLGTGYMVQGTGSQRRAQQSREEGGASVGMGLGRSLATAA